jgi:hypothetical protein
LAFSASPSLPATKDTAILSNAFSYIGFSRPHTKTEQTCIDSATLGFWTFHAPPRKKLVDDSEGRAPALFSQ